MSVMGMTTDKVNIKCERKNEEKEEEKSLNGPAKTPSKEDNKTLLVRRGARWDYDGTVEDETLLVRRKIRHC